MSMFRTLQNNPGTISLFNSKSTLSELLLKQLNNNSVKSYKGTNKSPSPPSLWSKIKNGFDETPEDGTMYLIDPIYTNPTFDQFKLIKSYTKDPNNLKIFNNSFPLFKDKSLDQDEFNKLIKDTHWFVDPLVVDWEKGNLANDKESLATLLKKYDE